jgi:two-component system, LytTR family, response regulator
MIRTLLVDDETTNSDILQVMLQQYCPGISVCGCAANIDDAERFISEQDPQLIFLDVQMPGGSGFDLLDRIVNKRTEVIFVTAYDNYLLQAIRYSALDYIMKPVNITEVITAVKRAEERIASKSINHQLELLLSNIRQPAQVQRIAIPHKDEYQFVPITDIVRLEARGAYTDIYLNNGKCYITSKNIKEFEGLLPANLFCRVHHAHLINLNFIKTYHKGRGGYIEMTTGVSIEVSVRRKDDFLSRFK